MKKWCFLIVVIIVSLVYVPTAKGSADDFLKALQDSLHKLGDPWIAGHTSVSRLPLEMKKKMLGLWSGVPEHVKIVERKSNSLKSPPSSWDWRTHNGHCWMTRIRNQSDPVGCGSCWDFGCVAALEARWNIWNNVSENDLNLSEQFVLSCNPFGYGCNGGRLDIWNWVMNTTNGIPDEDCFPYEASVVPCSPCPDWVARAAPYDIIDWGGTPRDREAMKYEIMRGPIAIGIKVGKDFFYYKGGVYEPIMGDDNLGDDDSKQYNHGVCCVGWTSDGAWIFKNSWGPDWGDPDMGCWDENGYGEIKDAGWAIWMDPIPMNVPFVKVEEVQVENDGNANHRLDPGESADIFIVLKNVGVDVTGVSSILRIGGTGITITDSFANYGEILKDRSVTNTLDPFHIEVSGGVNDGPQPVTLSITGNSGTYTANRYFQIWVGEERMHWADIVASKTVLTTTDNSAIGFDTLRGNGSGFIYPADTLYTNTIYSGTMAFGNSSSYLVDNWYVSDEVEHDWVPTTVPDGRLAWVSPPTRGDTMVRGQYADLGHSVPKNVLCEHSAWGFTENPDCGDFVILSYKYTNQGASAISGLYSGVFCDFDIGAVAKQNNDAGINESKYLAWVDDGDTYAGITLLDPLELFKNASTIMNVFYVRNGMTDANQYKFMNRTLHYFGAKHYNTNYSVVVSAGPFDLAPGESKIVAFAIVGGTSQSTIEDHADAARDCYIEIGVEDKIQTVSRYVTLEVMPNPALKKATITFSLPTLSNVEIALYDITGRHLQNLRQGQFKAGIHTLQWDTKKVSAGVFFVKLQTGNTALVKKVLVF